MLVLQLKRFEHFVNGTNVKLNEFVQYPLYLNMRDYCDRNTNQETPDIIYELTGILSHIGSINEGHYVVVLKINDGRWFKFNDSMISVIKEDEALKQQAYLLFYTVRQIN